MKKNIDNENEKKKLDYIEISTNSIIYYIMKSKEVKMNKLDIILEFSKNSPNRMRESYFKNNNISLYNDIIEYCSVIPNKPFKNKIWHWVNSINYDVLCNCGKPVSFNMNWKDGYKCFCSNKCSSNSVETKEKLKITLLEKYGVSSYSKTEEYMNKYKNTCIEKYGVDNYSKTEEYLEKSKATCLDRFGVDNYTKTEDYLIKSKKTYLDRYGVDNYTKTEDYLIKSKLKNIEKYGTAHIFQNNEYRINNFIISKEKNYIKYFQGLNYFKCDNFNHVFDIDTDCYFGRTSNNIPLCTICNPVGDQKSIKEKELFEFIKLNYSSEIVSGYRDSLEIDIYLPELKIGFEFNGLYWHSEKYKDRDYHINKTNYFKDKGIRIIHIWEDDWIFKKNIVKSQILNILGQSSNKIWARKCEIRLVNTKECREFLDSNHIQGFSKSLIKLGLYLENNILCIMTFDQFEGRKKMEYGGYNLSRFCNLYGFNVVGGASRLLSYFIRNYEVNRIVSYADKDWSIGQLYHTLGFENISESKSDYKYIVNKIRVHKSRYRKSRTNISESSLNIPKIWDCGKIKFEKLI